MPRRNRVEGLDEVLQNLNRHIADIEGKSIEGLFAAGLIVQAESQRRTPVDQGNLKASAYTRKFGNVGVEIGYTAHYAPYVHESVEMKLEGQDRTGGRKGRYWDPQGRGEAKFLENAVVAKQDEILNEIDRRARRRR